MAVHAVSLAVLPREGAPSRPVALPRELRPGEQSHPRIVHLLLSELYRLVVVRECHCSHLLWYNSTRWWRLPRNARETRRARGSC